MDRRVAKLLLLLLPLCFAVVTHGGQSGFKQTRTEPAVADHLASEDNTKGDPELIHKTFASALLAGNGFSGGNQTSCRACSADGEKHWCAWKVKMDVTFGDNWESIVGGACLPKTEACDSVKFGGIKDIVEAHYTFVGGTYYSVIQVDPSHAKCNDDEWPESLWRFPDRQSCVGAAATAQVGWCQIKGTTGRLSFNHHYDNGVCLPKALKPFCDRQVDPKGGDIKFPFLNGAAVKDLTTTWDEGSGGPTPPSDASCTKYSSCGGCLDSGLKCSWCSGMVSGSIAGSEAPPSPFGGKCVDTNEASPGGSCKGVQLGTLAQYFNITNKQSGGKGSISFSVDASTSEDKPSWCKTMEWPQEFWKYPTCSQCTGAQDAVAWCQLETSTGDIMTRGGACISQVAAVLCTGEVFDFGLSISKLYPDGSYHTAGSKIGQPASCPKD